MTRSIWAELGVTRGSDRDTVRRAYTRKLRTTNPEDDPEGFQRLRAAYEMALEQIDAAAHFESQDADAHQPSEGPDVAPWETAPDAMAVAVDQVGSLGDSHAGDDTDLAFDELDQMQGLRTSLVDSFEEQDPALVDVEVRVDLLKQMLHAPAMDSLQVREYTEIWLAGLIAHYSPFSDALIQPAIDFFQWNEDNYSEKPDAVAAVLYRVQELAWIKAVAGKGGELDAGWQALSGEMEQPWMAQLSARMPGVSGQVLILLDEMDHRFPRLQFYFNADRIAWWRAYLEKPRVTLDSFGPLLLMWFIAFFFVLAIDHVRADRTPAADLFDLGLLVLGPPVIGMVYVGFGKKVPVLGPVFDEPLGRHKFWIAAVCAVPILAMFAFSPAVAIFLLLAAVVASVFWTWRANPQQVSILTSRARVLDFLKNYWLFALYVFALARAPIAFEQICLVIGISLASAMAWARGGYQMQRFLAFAVPHYGAAVLVGVILLLLATGAAISWSSPPTDMAYRLALGSLICLGAMRILAGIQEEGPGMFFVFIFHALTVVLVLAAIALTDEQKNAAEAPREQVGGMNDRVPYAPAVGGQPDGNPVDLDRIGPLTENPPPVAPQPLRKPYVEAPCPTVAEDAPLPARAIPCGAPGTWITNEDYPASALRRDASGTVEIEATIGLDGRLGNCQVTKSSGHADLDSATCALLTERGKFLPARASNGAYASTPYKMRMEWVIAP